MMRTKQRVLCVLLLACGGCSGASTAGYDRLGINVHETDGMGTLSKKESHCFTFPILIGSRVETEYPVGAGVEIALAATRDEARISSEGAQDNVNRTYSAVDEAGQLDSFELSALSGERFVIDVYAGCSL